MHQNQSFIIYTMAAICIVLYVTGVYQKIKHNNNGTKKK